MFAPVSKHATLRTLLALAAAQAVELHQLDIKTGFLNGDLEETIFMQQPDRFAKGGPSMVCHLGKALYGLKQAPRAGIHALNRRWKVWALQHQRQTLDCS